MAEPVTNQDIMMVLGRQEEKIDYVIKLAEKTNGRVRSLEEWRNGLEAVESYKKEQQPQIKTDTVIIQSKWFQNEKLVSGVVALLLALAAAIGFFAGGH